MYKLMKMRGEKKPGKKMDQIVKIGLGESSCHIGFPSKSVNVLMSLT